MTRAKASIHDTHSFVLLVTRIGTMNVSVIAIQRLAIPRSIAILIIYNNYVDIIIQPYSKSHYTACAP